MINYWLDSRIWQNMEADLQAAMVDGSTIGELFENWPAATIDLFKKLKINAVECDEAEKLILLELKKD